MFIGHYIFRLYFIKDWSIVSTYSPLNAQSVNDPCLLKLNHMLLWYSSISTLSQGYANFRIIILCSLGKTCFQITKQLYVGTTYRHILYVICEDVNNSHIYMCRYVTKHMWAGLCEHMSRCVHVYMYTCTNICSRHIWTHKYMYTSADMPPVAICE